MVKMQTWSQGHNMQGQGQGLDLQGQGLDPEANVGYCKNYKSEKLELGFVKQIQSFSFVSYFMSEVKG